MFEIYRDTRGEYRWRVYDSNYRKVADSGEGDSSLAGAERAVANVKALAPAAQIAYSR